MPQQHQIQTKSCEIPNLLHFEIIYTFTITNIHIEKSNHPKMREFLPKNAATPNILTQFLLGQDNRNKTFLSPKTKTQYLFDFTIYRFIRDCVLTY